MIVKCSLCGGDNEIQPGQKMLFCSYCGSALAVEEQSGPERLILPHKRSDKHADEVLRSALVSRNLPRPRDIKIEFSYAPYLVIEDDKGQYIIAPGNKRLTTALPYPPAGDYRFFDESLAGGEKMLEIEQAGGNVVRILHLPVYSARYRCAGGDWEAIIIGEAWQVVADEFPLHSSASVNMANVIIAGVLFIAFLFIGRVMPTLLGRLMILFGAAAAGFFGLTLKERLVKKG